VQLPALKESFPEGSLHHIGEVVGENEVVGLEGTVRSLDGFKVIEKPLTTPSNDKSNDKPNDNKPKKL
jgi:hypothetical protein